MAAAFTADEQLVARAQEGQVDAYALLVERYQPLAAGLAALVMRNPAEADDVAQEAFLKAYYSLGQFRRGASFKAWLVQIVVNEARNARAAAQRRDTVHARMRDEVSRPTMSLSAEDTAVASEQRQALLLALDRLREDDRSVLVYRYVFDLSEAEMAEALACSAGTVKSRLSRALGRLRTDLSRVAPLLAGSPALGPQVGETLRPAAAPAGGASARSFASAVVGHITSSAAGGAAAGGGAGGAASGSGTGSRGRPTTQQVAATAAGIGFVALIAAGLLLSTGRERSTVPAPPAATSAAPSAAESSAAATAPTMFVVYGGDLTDAQRQELAATLAAGPQASTETVNRPELLSTLQAAGLAVDGSDRAISSAAVICLAAGDGLRVRTENVTQMPAAAYANALVTAGAVDADVIVAAPPSTPMTGETALVGVLKAYPHCRAGQAFSPERVRLAYDQLHVTADIAQSSGAWSHAAAVMLRGSQAAINSMGSDQVSINRALDAAAADEGLTLDPEQRTQALSVLSRLAAMDQGVYAAGFVVQEVATTEVRVLPTRR